MKHFIIFLLVIFSFCLVAEEVRLKNIEIRVYQSSDQKKLTIGDEIEVKLELSDKLPFLFLQNIFNNKFIFKETLYLWDIKTSLSDNKGYTQNIEGRASFIKPLVPQVNFDIPLKELGLNLKLINKNIEVFDDPHISKEKKPKVLDQNLLLKNSYWWLYILGIIGGFVLGGFFFRFYKKNKRKETLLRRKKLILRQIKKSQKRQDYEKMYSTRKEWKTLLKYDDKKYNHFIHVMEEHQYKKDWDQDIYNEVAGSVEKLVRSIRLYGEGEK